MNLEASFWVERPRGGHQKQHLLPPLVSLHQRFVYAFYASPKILRVKYDALIKTST